MLINVKIHNVKDTEMTRTQVKELLNLCCYEVDNDSRKHYLERKLTELNAGKVLTVSSNGQEYTLKASICDPLPETKHKLTTLFY